MNAPRGLGRDGRQAWRAATSALEAVGLDPALMVGAVERFARSADRLATVEAAWVELGRPATAEGSTGQLVAHPLLRELRDETRAVHELAKSLMPAQTAGWRRGRARSPDRAARGAARRRGADVIEMPLAVRRAIGEP